MQSENIEYSGQLKRLTGDIYVEEIFLECPSEGDNEFHTVLAGQDDNGNHANDLRSFKNPSEMIGFLTDLDPIPDLREALFANPQNNNVHQMALLSLLAAVLKH